MDEQVKQWLLLGREHFQKRELDKAQAYLDQVLAADDRFADVHDMLGLIAHSRGNYQAAEEHFTRALAINPAYTEAALNLAVTLNDRGKYKEARQVYERIQGKPTGAVGTLDPFARGKLANMHADLGAAYCGLAMFEESVREYSKALDLCPEFADLRVRLGNVYRDMGVFHAAVAEFEHAKRLRPDFIPARIHLGVTLFSLGRKDAALAEWQHVLTIDPNNKSAKLYVKMANDENGPRPGSALPR